MARIQVVVLTPETSDGIESKNPQEGWGPHACHTALGSHKHKAQSPQGGGGMWRDCSRVGCQACPSPGKDRSEAEAQGPIPKRDRIWKDRQ